MKGLRWKMLWKKERSAPTIILFFSSVTKSWFFSQEKRHQLKYWPLSLTGKLTDLGRWNENELFSGNTRKSVQWGKEPCLHHLLPPYC
jgi:hypothetical protein